MIEKTKRFITQKRYMKFLRDIIESYEDVAMMSVIDEDKGLIEFIYPESQEEELTLIIDDLRAKGIELWEIGGRDERWGKNSENPS